MSDVTMKSSKEASLKTWTVSHLLNLDEGKCIQEDWNYWIVCYNNFFFQTLSNAAVDEPLSEPKNKDMPNNGTAPVI